MNSAQDCSNGTDQEPSRGFLQLPPELRNSIYELAFPCANNTAYNPVVSFRNVEPCQCFGHPLTKGSKQLRNETLSLHYNIHEFHFVLYRQNKAVLESWVNDIAQDWLVHVRRFQLRGYAGINSIFRQDSFSTVHFDLQDAQAEVNARLPGKNMAVERRLRDAVKSMPHIDGRQRLTKAILLELFDIVGWD